MRPDKWRITRHAFERFLQLFPRRSVDDLRHVCETAHLVTVVEDVEHWRAARPTRIQFRVRAGVLVTVLPSNAHHKRRGIANE